MLNKENRGSSQLRQSIRELQSSKMFSPYDYVMIPDTSEPESYREAQQGKHKREWLKVIYDEMDSLQKNHTYNLMKLLQGQKIPKNKWVFRLKSKENNSQSRYKTRLVVKYFRQKKGVDCEEIFFSCHENVIDSGYSWHGSWY